MTLHRNFHQFTLVKLILQHHQKRFVIIKFLYKEHAETLLYQFGNKIVFIIMGMKAIITFLMALTAIVVMADAQTCMGASVEDLEEMDNMIQRMGCGNWCTCYPFWPGC